MITRAKFIGGLLLALGVFGGAFFLPRLEWDIKDAEPRVLWKKQLGSEIEQSPAVDVSGRVYIAAENGTVASYEKNGQEKWRTETGAVIIRSSPVIVGEYIVVGDEDGIVRALHRATGKVIWARALGSGVRTTAAYDAGREVLYMGTMAGEIVALTAQGEVLWRVDVGGPVSSSPAIDSDGTLYVGNHVGDVVALKDGKRLWIENVGAMVLASPAITNEGVVVGAEDGGVTLLRRDGSVLWAWRAPDEGTVNRGIESSPAIGYDGTVYVGSKNHRLYALREGKLRWAVTLGWEVESSPVIGHDGTIYVGAEDHNVYAITPGGKLLWAVRTGGQVDSPPVISGDVLYFGSQDGFLYATQLATSGMAASLWPKFHANAQNDGRVEE